MGLTGDFNSQLVQILGFLKIRVEALVHSSNTALVFQQILHRHILFVSGRKLGPNRSNLLVPPESSGRDLLDGQDALNDLSRAENNRQSVLFNSTKYFCQNNGRLLTRQDAAKSVDHGTGRTHFVKELRLCLISVAAKQADDTFAFVKRSK